MANMIDYAKLKEDGTLEYIPDFITVDGVTYVKFDGSYPEEIANKAGYKKVVDTPYPTDGNTYNAKWEEEDNSIVKIWIVVPVPEPTPLTPAEEREKAYETKLCVVYPENSDTLITIDNAVNLVKDYSCELTEKAEDIVSYLKIQITDQKAIIRQEYPDEEGGNE